MDELLRAGFAALGLPLDAAAADHFAHKCRNRAQEMQQNAQS